MIVNGGIVSPFNPKEIWGLETRFAVSLEADSMGVIFFS